MNLQAQLESWNWCARGRNARLEFFCSGNTISRQCSCYWISLKTSRATLSKSSDTVTILPEKTHNECINFTRKLSSHASRLSTCRRRRRPCCRCCSCCCCCCDDGDDDAAAADEDDDGGGGDGSADAATADGRRSPRSSSSLPFPSSPAAAVWKQTIVYFYKHRKVKCTACD